MKASVSKKIYPDKTKYFATLNASAQFDVSTLAIDLAYPALHKDGMEGVALDHLSLQLSRRLYGSLYRQLLILEEKTMSVIDEVQTSNYSVSVEELEEEFRKIRDSLRVELGDLIESSEG